MPDLKSELQKLKDLKFDDEPETSTPATAPAPENNMTLRVFNWFRDNPMSTVAECVAGSGLDTSAVSARAAQLFKRNALTRTKRGDEAYRYSAAIDHLMDRQEAIKAALIKANAVKQLNKVKRAGLAKARAAKAAKAKERLPAVQLVQVDAFDATKIVSAWTPFQAKAVYDELKRLFGGGL